METAIVKKDDLAGDCIEWFNETLQYLIGSNGNGTGPIKLYKTEFDSVPHTVLDLKNGIIMGIESKDTDQIKSLRKKIKERLNQFYDLKYAETELKKLEIEKLYSLKDACKIAGKKYNDIEERIKEEEKKLIDPEIEEGITSLSELLKQNPNDPTYIIARAIYFNNYFRFSKNGNKKTMDADNAKKNEYPLDVAFFMKVNKMLIDMQQYL